MLKRAISLLLTFSLLLSAVTVGVYALEDDPKLSVAVASDLHYKTPVGELEHNLDDPVYWYANRAAAMENESGFIIDEFLDQCAEDDDCAYVLLTGDLTTDGRSKTEDHRAVAEKLRAFEAETGKQVLVINGNHDLSEKSLTNRAVFKEIYADFGYDLALVQDEKTCSYTANLGEHYRLIALDSCHDTASTEDGMTAERIEWVCTQAKLAKKDGRYPILMMHHNLLDHLPMQRIISRNFIVKAHYATAELFADCGIKVVLTGHEHCSDAAVFTSALGNVIYDFATTSLSMYPLEYRMFHLHEDEITYESKRVDSLDTDALAAAVKGYSDEQIKLMNSGLNAYAKGFLKSGIKYRLELSLSMEKMGISEDDFYYGIVKTAVDGLTDMLEMPLYGKNSIQSLAKDYDLDIPDSAYKTGWDLLTDLAAKHFAGEEAYTLDSAEVTILLRMAALILRTDLADVSDEIFFKAANNWLGDLGIESVSDELTKLAVSVFGAVTPGEYFMLAIASPLLYEFAYDSDGVNDNAGVIPGYGTASLEGNIENIKTNINHVLYKVMHYIDMILHYLFKMLNVIK